jgi:hypothetical protein
VEVVLAADSDGDAVPDWRCVVSVFLTHERLRLSKTHGHKAQSATRILLDAVLVPGGHARSSVGGVVGIFPQ